jgi:hypothetical protein
MAKSCYPNDFVFLALPVVDIFYKIPDIWQRTLPKFSPVAKTLDATPYREVKSQKSKVKSQKFIYSTFL